MRTRGINASHTYSAEETQTFTGHITTLYAPLTNLSNADFSPPSPSSPLSPLVLSDLASSSSSHHSSTFFFGCFTIAFSFFSSADGPGTSLVAFFTLSAASAGTATTFAFL